MAGKPGTRLDRFFLWSMFILPSVVGTLSWMMRDRLESGTGLLMALAGWGCGALGALTLLFDHYRRPPSGR